MAAPSKLADDYFVVTRQDRVTDTWLWEIHRRSTPLGVWLNRNGFASHSAAKLAGEKALKFLLDGIVEEEKKDRLQESVRRPDRSD
jgi:hypothetical protein